MKKFNCTECGLCCTKVGGIIANVKKAGDKQLEAAYEDFPYTYDEKGVCEKYDPKTKHCTVYDTRPEMCDIDRMFYKHYHKVYKSKSSYYQDIEDTCLYLQKYDGQANS